VEADPRLLFSGAFVLACLVRKQTLCYNTK
jgi:hypothetical protein